MTDRTHELWDIRFANSIIDAMAEGVFTMDADGRISSWNRSMERISGFTALEALGQTCSLLHCSRCFGTECPSGIAYCGIINLGHSEAKECLIRHKLGHDVPVIKNASVVKDVHGHVLGVVETVTDLTELNRERQRAQEAALRLGDIHRLHNIIGKSRPMRQVFTAIEAAAASEATVLIQGESGTGKELVAGAIHFNSDRKQGPLVAVNCSALSETLLESELFGHVRGAFTGALRDRPGRFEEAAGGTVFLDEIGELNPSIQVKLLRVLQEREVERVGDSKKIKIDIRIVAATHQDLYQKVQQGHFREDLYYRLKVFPIHLPALKDRREDIPLLVSHFIHVMNGKTGKRITNLSQEALRLFLSYPWPGNVRELENAIEHAFVLRNRDQIIISDLPVEIRHLEYESSGKNMPPDPCQIKPARRSRKKMTQERLVELLTMHEWNKAAVARDLGLSHTAIWKYMKKWAIPLQRENPS
jgi:PAS domain S-box-containing protein